MNLIPVDINLTIDTETIIPSEFSEKWKIGKTIRSTDKSQIYYVTSKSKQTHVMKIIPFNTTNSKSSSDSGSSSSISSRSSSSSSSSPPTSTEITKSTTSSSKTILVSRPYLPKDQIRNELCITKKMAKLSIGPAVYDWILTDTFGALIIEKFDQTLGNLITQSPFDPRIFQFLKKSEKLLKRMHKNGILHGDFHLNNILIKDTGEIVISDFGMSLETNSKEIFEDEMQYMDGIWKLYSDIKDSYDKIKDNIKTNRDVAIYALNSIPNTNYQFSYYWNGEKCLYWNY